MEGSGERQVFGNKLVLAIVALSLVGGVFVLSFPRDNVAQLGGVIMILGSIILIGSYPVVKRNLLTASVLLLIGVVVIALGAILGLTNFLRIG